MKKYRITKITVKTREIISLSTKPANENQFPVCPVCHSPVSGSLSISGDTVETSHNENRPLALLTNEVSD